MTAAAAPLKAQQELHVFATNDTDSTTCVCCWPQWHTHASKHGARAVRDARHCDRPLCSCWIWGRTENMPTSAIFTLPPTTQKHQYLHLRISTSVHMTFRWTCSSGPFQHLLLPECKFRRNSWASSSSTPDCAPTKSIKHIKPHIDHLFWIFKGRLSTVHGLESNKPIALGLLRLLVHHHSCL